MARAHLGSKHRFLRGAGKIASRRPIFNPAGLTPLEAALSISLAESAPSCYTCPVVKPKSSDLKSNDPTVVIYMKPGCPYCAKARAYYTQKGLDFEERNAQDVPEFRRQMLSVSGGDPTVPVIVENGVLKQIGWEGRG